MSKLGKRKEREEDESSTQVHGSTLFVSNISYAVTSTDLQTLFSDIAPVRSAFVVLEHGSGASKGVGYVSFAIKEDARVAFDKISVEGLSILGRPLRVEWAQQKPKDKDKENAVEAHTKTRPPLRASQPRKPHDPLAIRTITITGLPHSINSKSLWKKLRKYEGAEKVEWPVHTDDGEDLGSAHTLFNTPTNAQKAVEKLHAHVFKGSLLSVALKKRIDNLAKPATKLLKQKASISQDEKDDVKVSSTTTKASGKAPSYASRLIVRNIPFNASEQDLRAVFLPYGPIYAIHIPSQGRSEEEGVKTEEVKTEEESPAPKKLNAGFAFVWMLSKKDAEKAIDGCNGTVFRAGVAEAMIADKQKRKKQRREEKNLMKVKEGDLETSGGKPLEKVTERTIAVDWALSKDKWQEEKAKGMNHDDNDVDMDSSDGSEYSGSSSGEGDQGTTFGLHQDTYESSDEDSTGDSDEDGLDQLPTKPQLPPPETGTTVFIRNVPFTATEDELRTLFRAFGPLRYVRITIDSVTGRSRGTGFGCFWNKEDADKVLQQSELLRSETTGVEMPKKNPFATSSILTPDPSSTMAQSLVLHGRTLDVVLAVTRDEAGKLKEEGDKKREKADKRNIYLLREGVILPNTSAAETLTAAEVEKRTSSFNARRALLRSNPSLYISKTRLSVRQIPLFVTERMLKRLSIHAIREFESEVKGGLRVGLTDEELAEGAGTDKAENVERKAGRKAVEKLIGVKQAKIVRQVERVDPVTGKGRSKGYGFIELRKHTDALRVLRWSNNNPGVGSLFEGWWKEELGDLIKQEEAKDEKNEARLKRMKEEMNGHKGKKNAGVLVVEFSVENVQVVRRRSAHHDEVSTTKKQDRPLKHAEQTVKTSQRPPKKQRVSEDSMTETSSVKEETVTPGRLIGSLIGRKRRERRKTKS